MLRSACDFHPSHICVVVVVVVSSQLGCVHTTLSKVVQLCPSARRNIRSRTRTFTKSLHTTEHELLLKCSIINTLYAPLMEKDGSHIQLSSEPSPRDNERSLHIDNQRNRYVDTEFTTSFMTVACLLVHLALCPL